MKRNLLKRQILLLSQLGLLAGCASHEKSTAPVIKQGSGQWDYKKVQEVRDAEAQTPAKVYDPKDDAMCQVMTHTEMVRAKAQGCRPLDPRMGHGDHAFCCPPDSSVKH